MTIKQGDWLHSLIEKTYGKLPDEDGKPISAYTKRVEQGLLYDQYGRSDVYAENDGGVLGEYDRFTGKFTQ